MKAKTMSANRLLRRIYDINDDFLKKVWKAYSELSLERPPEKSKSPRLVKDAGKSRTAIAGLYDDNNKAKPKSQVAKKRSKK